MPCGDLCLRRQENAVLVMHEKAVLTFQQPTCVAPAGDGSRLREKTAEYDLQDSASAFRTHMSL
jgi:hypothetical protein